MALQLHDMVCMYCRYCTFIDDGFVFTCMLAFEVLEEIDQGKMAWMRKRYFLKGRIEKYDDSLYEILVKNMKSFYIRKDRL